MLVKMGQLEHWLPQKFLIKVGEDLKKINILVFTSKIIIEKHFFFAG